MRHINAYDPFLAVLGKVPGVRRLEISGGNFNIDLLGPGYLTPNGEANFPAAAAVLQLVSDSAEDDTDKGAETPGTGAFTVRVEGLDANYNEISEIVTMNGTDAVLTTAEFLRFNHAVVVSAGSGGTNAGNITISDEGGSTQYGYIYATIAVSGEAVYTVPADHSVLLYEYTASGLIVASGAAVVQGLIQYRPYGGILTPFSGYFTTGGFYSETRQLPYYIPEKSDIIVYGYALTGDDTLTQFRGSALLVNNASVA